MRVDIMPSILAVWVAKLSFDEQLSKSVDTSATTIFNVIQESANQEGHAQLAVSIAVTWPE